MSDDTTTVLTEADKLRFWCRFERSDGASLVEKYRQGWPLSTT